MVKEKLKKWRLILGKDVDAAAQGACERSGDGWDGLSSEEITMDEALAAIYDETSGDAGGAKSQGKGGKGKSVPNLAKWLGDVRSLFPENVVSVIQNDAINKKGLKQLLLEPETLSTIKPDVSIVATIMALNRQIPEKSKENARILVRAVVDELTKLMEQDLRRAVTGALNKKNHSPIPSLSGIDWKRTISRNLKHYDNATKRLIPEKFWFYERQRRMKDWTVILDMDQSGSMADSIIYASVMGAIFASMPALDTKVVAFDTEVVDLTEVCRNDPVDVLFGVQLGGGTDINKSVGYCSQFIENPRKTIFILISDLEEGGVEAGLIRKLTEMHESGVKVIALLALTDSGVPHYDERIAKKVSSIGIPCFACTPDRLPELIESALKGKDLIKLGSDIHSRKK
ncbi:VWA domain-containing protein [Myxococcota bacterium]|nr:VWA domain-containing protein [Myxococcota bacterium]MBU1382698.1 VWA domain-containing protein [Myxococcota bacterium]MBU1497721.1 VWA domain-containing protein [Myxococcota bacterium]